MANLEVLVAAVTGLISGAVGSLVAPWVNWRVQRVRDQTEYRRQQIKRWREAIHSFDFATSNFADTVVYAELRPYLDEAFRRGLESGRTFGVPARGRGDSATKHAILDAITERERKWRLI
jgi:hypothetical protein